LTGKSVVALVRPASDENLAETHMRECVIVRQRRQLLEM
jgi:hypothetical protein